MMYSVETMMELGRQHHEELISVARRGELSLAAPLNRFRRRLGILLIGLARQLLGAEARPILHYSADLSSDGRQGSAGEHQAA